MELIYRKCGPDHSVLAFDGEEHIGGLWWKVNGRRVMNVWVHPMMRRRGIATDLWRYAETLEGIQPRHAPKRERTADGKAWVESLERSTVSTTR